MDRLIAANSVNLAGSDVAPGAGTPQYATNGNPALNIPATKWPAYQYNAMQEELINIILAAGITPDKTNNAQVIAAIKALIQLQSVNYATITGTGNAIVATLNPPLTAHVVGMPIRFKPIAGNAFGDVTFNPGPSAKPLLRGATLATNVIGKFGVGDLSTGAIFTAVYDGASYRVQEISYSAPKVLPSVVIPNDGSSHDVFDLVNVVGGSSAYVHASLECLNVASSSVFMCDTTAYQFAASISTSNSTTQNTPGTVSLTMLGTVLRMSVTGGSGALTVNPVTKLP